MTKIIGSGMPIEGQNGTIGYSSWWGGPANVSVINQGTISANVVNGTITINAQPFTNSGLVESPTGALSVSVWQNTGQTIVVTTNTGPLRLVGGTIQGGSITTSNGVSLIVEG